MLVTSLDLETSGLDLAKDRITEIGAVLWDVEARRPVTFLSYLISDHDAPPLSQEVVEITGIDDKALRDFGVGLVGALGHLAHFLRHSAAVVVHGGLQLDKGLVERDYKRLVGDLPEIPWIDTMVDFSYPKHMKMRALKYLASDHKHYLDYAHRGLFDAVATIAIASQYDIASALELAKHPIIKIRAEVDIKTKDEAKTRGYFYDNNTRSWYKNVRVCLLEQERGLCPFAVTQIV